MLNKLHTSAGIATTSSLFPASEVVEAAASRTEPLDAAVTEDRGPVGGGSAHIVVALPILRRSDDLNMVQQKV